MLAWGISASFTRWSSEWYSLERASLIHNSYSATITWIDLGLLLLCSTATKEPSSSFTKPEVFHPTYFHLFHQVIDQLNMEEENG